MDRRNFLRTGGLVALGALAAPSLSMCRPLGGADGKSGVAAAMAHFGVTESDLKKVMTAALEKGGDYVDLYFEHTFSNSVSLMDGKVNNCSSNIDFGMGVRVLAGDQTGYAYVEGVTLDEMLRAARTAARIASSGKAGKPVGLTEKEIKKNRYPVVSPWEEVTVKDKIPFLEKINEKVFALDKRVSKVQASLSDSTTHVLFCNSEGVSYYDYRPMVNFVAFCVMEEKVKLVYSAVGDHVLLFDLNTDPMEQHNLAEDPDWQERKAKLWKLLLEHTAQYTPEALDENGQFLTYEAPRFPGDMPGRWFGFHYHDYSVDTFH